jgi:hypothetical protein
MQFALNVKCQNPCLRQAGKCQINAKWLNVKNFLGHSDFGFHLNFEL